MSTLRHPWVSIAFQTVLGGIFLYACYHKIVDPPKFAKDIYNYKITPGELINLTAIYLPWIELVAGAALVIGFWNRGATALAGGMLLVFIAALGYDYYRGHPVDCACFQAAGTTEKTTPEMLAEMRRRIIQDAGMFLLVVYVLWMEPVGRPWLPGWKRSGETPVS